MHVSSDEALLRVSSKEAIDVLGVVQLKRYLSDVCEP